MKRTQIPSFLAILVAVPLVTAVAPAAESNSPSAADALKLTPLQKGIDYDQPSATEAANCKITARKAAGQVGWIVEDPAGLVLRRFVDTNGDNVVDQWSYYKDGLEVYRDIDSDFNRKADQCRWFHTAGARWGIDKDEDGRIDSWKAISPEEVSAEVVAALAAKDAAVFLRLALAPAELDALGLGPERSKDLKRRLEGLPAAFQQVLGRQKTIDGSTKWLHFSGGRPGVVPRGTDESTEDLLVYENAAALVETQGKPTEVLIGTLVRVGDAWRLIGPPHLEGDQPEADLAGFFFRPSIADRPRTAMGGSDEAAQKLQKILAELEEIDKALHEATTPEKQAPLNAQRADKLEQAAAMADASEDRAMWLRQLADTVGAAVQSGGYPDGAKRLASLYEKLSKSENDKDLAAYVRFRQLAAEYGLSFQAPKPDPQKIQETWVANLKQFVKDYPKVPDAAEAMLQLGMTLEFTGDEDEAKTWYGRLADEFPNAPSATKAAGARRRLDSVGKPLALSGKTASGEPVDLSQFRGKAVLIQYWATWSEPAKTDMAVLKELVSKYGSKFGVIGVSLDRRPEDLSAFLRENRLPWPQVYEEGGLDSRPANEMGILTVPTMILVDPEGKVVRRNIAVAELDGELKKLLR